MPTIDAFTKACRLSPKALRLYDEPGLLRPARVDPDTGYRSYAAGQSERARPGSPGAPVLRCSGAPVLR